MIVLKIQSTQIDFHQYSFGCTVYSSTFNFKFQFIICDWARLAHSSWASKSSHRRIINQFMDINNSHFQSEKGIQSNWNHFLIIGDTEICNYMLACTPIFLILLQYDLKYETHRAFGNHGRLYRYISFTLDTLRN